MFKLVNRWTWYFTLKYFNICRSSRLTPGFPGSVAAKQTKFIILPPLYLILFVLICSVGFLTKRVSMHYKQALQLRTPCSKSLVVWSGTILQSLAILPQSLREKRHSSKQVILFNILLTVSARVYMNVCILWYYNRSSTYATQRVDFKEIWGMITCLTDLQLPMLNGKCTHSALHNFPHSHQQFFLCST